MDTLSDAIRHLHLKTSVFHRLTHCGRWTIDTEYERKAMFHLVGAGVCEVIADDGLAVRLTTGDAVLFMRPVGHRVVSAPEASATQETLLLCGYFEFDSPLAKTLLGSLPVQVILRGSAGSVAGSPGAAASVLLRLIVDETANNEAGSDALLDKLADALFIFAIRQCLAEGQLQTGILRVMGDGQLRAAMEAMHGSPEYGWTVGTLAARASLSRAAFARRFRAAMGVSPGRYLTGLRLQIGRAALEEQGMTLSQAAEHVGYSDEASFSRAFKHLYGVSPGSVRGERQERER